MKFDDVLEQIGGFGRYQQWIFFLSCISYLLAGIYMLNPVFILGVPLHRCALSGYDNDTYAIQDDQHARLIQQMIPPSHIDLLTYDRCTLNSSVIQNDTTIKTRGSSRKPVSCSRWVYDKSEYTETFVSQMDLVCDKEIWVANAGMIFYGGMFVGSLLSGIMADRFGRKKAMYISALLLIGSSFSLSWANSYAAFAVLHFIQGGSVVACMLTSYIISIEITGVEKRVWPGVIGNFPYVMGELLLAAAAYGLRDWIRIQLYTAIPSVLLIPFWWLMPESPRWLLTKGRKKEAEDIIRTAAKWNKVELPVEIFEELHVEDNYENEGTFRQLFSSKTLCTRSMLIFFNWTVVAMGYFGLALNSGNLVGGLYLNFVLSCLVEVPAYIITILLIDRIGRRKLYCFMMLIGGLASVSTIFSIRYGSEGLAAITVTLAMLGKLGITAGYSVQYVHTAELFPTVLRNAGIGTASLFARVGTMISPYIVTLGDFIGGSEGQALPLIVFGSLSFMSGLLSLMLPETLNEILPETVEDVELIKIAASRKKKKTKEESTDASDIEVYEMLKV